MILSWLRQTRPYQLYQLARSGYLHEQGWLRSVREQQSVDFSGNPFPWITYPCLKFLEQRIHKRMTVFEYGSGNSTLWWAARVGKVISYEHDHDWYRKMEKRVPPHVEINYVSLEAGGEYSRKILEYPGQVNIVMVDGCDRINCLKNAPVALCDDGVIILDNSDREEYKEGTEFLRNRGYNRLDFHGIGPINAYSWCTSIFYRASNCLEI